MIYISKGLSVRLAVLGHRQEAIEELMPYGVLNIYGGDVPKDADTPTIAPLLARCYPPDWRGGVVATGNATFFRWEQDAPDGDVLCVQGNVGGGEGEMKFASATLCLGMTITMTQFSVAF